MTDPNLSRAQSAYDNMEADSRKATAWRGDLMDVEAWEAEQQELEDRADEEYKYGAKGGFVHEHHS